VKSGGCDPRISSCREALPSRAFKNIIFTPVPCTPARLFDAGYSSRTILSTAGHVFDARFGSEEGTITTALAAGVGGGGGQPESNARTWRSSAVDQLRESRVFGGGKAGSSTGRRRVAARGATRYGSGGPQDRPPPEITGTTEGIRIYIFPYPTSFAERRLDPRGQPPSPLLSTQLSTKLP
jgi:hypothetical protein